MANAKRGLIAIDLDGEEHALRFPTSVMRELQERFKAKTPNDVWSSIPKWGIDDYAHVIFLGLQKGSHPDITKEDVEDLVLGTEMTYYQAVFMDAIMSSLEGRTVSDRTKGLIDKALGAAEDKVAAGGAVENP